MFKEAEPLLRESLEIFRRNLGTDNNDVASAAQNRTGKRRASVPDNAPRRSVLSNNERLQTSVVGVAERPRLPRPNSAVTRRTAFEANQEHIVNMLAALQAPPSHGRVGLAVVRYPGADLPFQGAISRLAAEAEAEAEAEAAAERREAR